MVLKLVDTRTEKNSKLEMYAGMHLGHIVEGIKVYSRVTVHHQFKFVREMFRCELSDSTFSDIKNVKAVIEDTFDKVKSATGEVCFTLSKEEGV